MSASIYRDITILNNGTDTLALLKINHVVFCSADNGFISCYE